jgi:hypothetical protein
MQRRTFFADTLPLGDLPNYRYPDRRVEAHDRPFKARIGHAAIVRIATGFRWAEGRFLSATAASCYGATFQTIASCVGSRTTAM